MDLRAAVALLRWDQVTYMPPGGAAARCRQLALLQGLAKEKFTDPVSTHLLDALQPYADSLPDDADYAVLIRVTDRQYERACQVPPAFAAEMAPQLIRLGAKRARPMILLRCSPILREPPFVTMHEAGDTLYEQGIVAPLESTPLGTGISGGVHKSQSRRWENVMGGS